MASLSSFSRQGIVGLSLVALFAVGCSAGDDGTILESTSAAQAATAVGPLPALSRDAGSKKVLVSRSTFEMATDDDGGRYVVFELPSQDVRFLNSQHYVPGFIQSLFNRPGDREVSPISGSVASDVAFLLAGSLGKYGEEDKLEGGKLDVVILLNEAFSPATKAAREATVWVQGQGKKVRLPQY